jgi:acetyl-CoA synthetase
MNVDPARADEQYTHRRSTVSDAVAPVSEAYRCGGVEESDMRHANVDLSIYDDYDKAYADFEWEIPDEYNVARSVCDRWADAPEGDKTVALSFKATDGARERHTFADVRRRANRVANALGDLGVDAGTRVGVSLPQRPETLISYVGIWKRGASVVPLSVLFGDEGLRYRLDHANVEVLVCDEGIADTYATIADDLESVEMVVTLDDPPGVDGVRWEDVVPPASADFETRATAADDESFVLYTSGTTGDPKGVRLPHQYVIGCVPGWQFVNEFPDRDAVHYSPASWSWNGGMIAVAMMAWYHGQEVVGYDGRFDPAAVYEVFDQYEVTNSMLTPTMIRMLRDAGGEHDRYPDTVVCGGEDVSSDIYRYVEDAWGGVVNNVYGQTEALFLVVTNSRLTGTNVGATGKPAPGHVVDVVDPDAGEVCPAGELGEIAVAEPDPVMMLDYWNDPERTAAAFVDGWMKTGDAGIRDEGGWVAFVARADDVIITSGYRVSPLEVEDCLQQLPEVNDSAVVGVDDETRGTVLKAFVKLAADASASDDLRDHIQSHVRNRLAAYKYPREIDFVDSLPTTVTGKIQRFKLTDDE